LNFGPRRIIPAFLSILAGLKVPGVEGLGWVGLDWKRKVKMEHRGVTFVSDDGWFGGGALGPEHRIVIDQEALLLYIR